MEYHLTNKTRKLDRLEDVACSSPTVIEVKTVNRKRTCKGAITSTTNRTYCLDRRTSALTSLQLNKEISEIHEINMEMGQAPVRRLRLQSEECSVVG